MHTILCLSVLTEIDQILYTMLKCIKTLIFSQQIFFFGIFKVDKKLVLNVANDYPFFVYGHGWSSIEPNLTFNQQDLSCRQLKTDDICLVLTYCVLSASRKNRVTTTKSCTYKMALSNENYPVNFKSQSTPKSVPFLNDDAKNNYLPLTGSER